MVQPQAARAQVIIVGGGITGLTLANALQHVNVDYLVLEGRSEIAPRLGASIGLAPNGSRILDQLSCYDELEHLAQPILSAGYHNAQGNELCPRTDGFQLFQARTNYPVTFLERQQLLEVLGKHIQEPSRIHLGKKVANIEHLPDGVVVHCTDGTTYHGDIVAGADGASSKVRREMWRAAGSEISSEEQKAMSSQYRCIFGISTPLPELPSGYLNITHREGVSSLVISGKGGRVFWFLFEEMPQVHTAPNLPRFTSTDADALATKYRDHPILPKGAVTFGDLWKCKTASTLQALEEANYKTWTWGRFACVGDSMHKMTPNAGAGGMAAIESAAALANSIHALYSKQPSPSLANIRHALEQYHGSRKERATDIVTTSNMVTRIQAIKGLKERLVVNVALPYGGDFRVDGICDMWIGSTLLDFLPVPKRSLTANMPLDQPTRSMKKPTPPSRILRALPFLVLAFLCSRTLRGLLPPEELERRLSAGKISWGNSNTFDLWTRFYGASMFDRLARPSTVLFAPSSFAIDALSWTQMLTFMADIGLLYSIVLVESSRRANMMSLVRFPLIFSMASFRRVGVFMPVYYFFYYLFCPVFNFKAADSRLTDISYTASILPTMIIGFYVPYLLAYAAPSLAVRHAGMWIWHFSPILISLGQRVLSKTVSPRTLQYDRLHNPKRDVRTIRITVGTLAIVSALIYLYSITSTPSSIVDLFVPKSYHGDPSFEGMARKFFQWDQLYFSASSLLWIVVMFAELRREGFTSTHWVFVAVVLGGLSVATGAGAATAVGWLWREEILLRNRPVGGRGLNQAAREKTEG